VRIPILDIKWAKGERYAVEASAYIDKHLLSTFAFVVDTGSPLTIIMEDDLKRIRINLGNYEQVDYIDLAKARIKLVDLGNQTFNFHADANKLASFRFKAFGGIRGGDARGYPSILGKDFLDKFNVGLTRMEKTKSEARRYLEFDPGYSSDITVKEI
jgi:hypothetical protein